MYVCVNFCSLWLCVMDLLFFKTRVLEWTLWDILLHTINSFPENLPDLTNLQLIYWASRHCAECMMYNRPGTALNLMGLTVRQETQRKPGLNYILIFCVECLTSWYPLDYTSSWKWQHCQDCYINYMVWVLMEPTRFHMINPQECRAPC